MYNPPKSGNYCYMLVQVYEQGQELARQKKPFVNPYPRTPANRVPYDPYAYNYGYTPYSIEDEFNDWFRNGYNDFPVKDKRYPDPEDMPKLIQPRVKKCKVVLKDGEKAIVEIKKAPAKRKPRAKKTVAVEKEFEAYFSH